MRKKSGQPLAESFSHPLYLHALRELCRHLNHLPPLSELDLAMAVFKVVSILDKYCGKGASHQHVLTKLPIRVFEDFSVNGSLHCILESILQRPLSYLDAVLQGASEEVIEEGLSVLSQIDTNLRDRGFLTHPKIFFGASVPHTIIPELRNIVSKHKGEIVRSESMATHIIEW